MAQQKAKKAKSQVTASHISPNMKAAPSTKLSKNVLRSLAFSYRQANAQATALIREHWQNPTALIQLTKVLDLAGINLYYRVRKVETRAKELRQLTTTETRKER